MLHIVGDINLSDGFFDTGFGVGSFLKKKGDPFSYIDFNEEDLYVGNFEFVCSNITNKSGVYSKQFITNILDIDHLRHFDIYSVANNHIMQHGQDAYLDTLKNIKCLRAEYVGDLKKKTHCFKHKDYSVGMMSFSLRHENFSKDPLYWNLPEFSEIHEEFANIINQDLKICYLHWGNEFINIPNEEQKKFAHWLIDIGFDLVVGNHSHVLQGYEIYKNKYIFYSLGNFVFNMPHDDTKHSVMLNIDFENGHAVVNFDYIELTNDGLPQIKDKSCIPDHYTFPYLNSLLKLSIDNESYYSLLFKKMNSYRKCNMFNFLRNILKFNYRDLISVIKDFVYRRFVQK